MVFGQFFLLGLPILPGVLDCYLQAKFKQLVVNPIYNFFYTIFVSVLGSILALLLGILEDIAKASMCVLNVVYQDIIYLLSLFLYLFMYTFWALAMFFQWCYSVTAPAYHWGFISLYWHSAILL